MEKKADERQLKLIELLVEGHLKIGDACIEAGVPISTYYEWRKNETKPAKAFNKAYDEALELKIKESRKYIKSRVNELLGSLMEITKSGKNENARVNAISKLFNFAELDPAFKQELTVKETDDRNTLLELWKNKKSEQENND